MSEEPAPERITVVGSLEGRAELRAIDRATALEILHCIDHYLATRTGDVKRPKLLSPASDSAAAIIAFSSMPRTKEPSISPL